MASQALPLEEAVQILQDAGCTRDFTQQFITALEAEPIQVQLRLLRVQRQCQLDQVHMEEKSWTVWTTCGMCWKSGFLLRRNQTERDTDMKKSIFTWMGPPAHRFSSARTDQCGSFDALWG